MRGNFSREPMISIENFGRFTSGNLYRGFKPSNTKGDKIYNFVGAIVLNIVHTGIVDRMK
jgi:hypothetical protein